MLQSLRSTPLHMRIRYLDQQASYEGPSKLSHTRKTGPEGASAVPNLVYLPPVNKSYFRHSETFTPSKLIIFHQGIRFSRSRRPEEAKRTNLSPSAFQLYFKSKNILPGELEMSRGAREELNASLGRNVNESSDRSIQSSVESRLPTTSVPSVQPL